MALKNTKILVAGLIVAIVFAVVWFILDKGDVDTGVVLEDRESQCVVTTKENEVRIHKNKRLSWVIDNRCSNKDELVTVGNFRMSQESSATDCLQPTEGTNVVWPFQEDMNDLSKRQHKNKISLKIKKDSDLPGSSLVYYYDICTGSSAERKSDPRLVIDE